MFVYNILTRLWLNSFWISFWCFSGAVCDAVAYVNNGFLLYFRKMCPEYCVHELNLYHRCLLAMVVQARFFFLRLFVWPSGFIELLYLLSYCTCWVIVLVELLYLLSYRTCWVIVRVKLAVTCYWLPFTHTALLPMSGQPTQSQQRWLVPVVLFISSCWLCRKCEHISSGCWCVVAPVFTCKS